MVGADKSTLRILCFAERRVTTEKASSSISCLFNLFICLDNEADKVGLFIVMLKQCDQIGQFIGLWATF